MPALCGDKIKPVNLKLQHAHLKLVSSNIVDAKQVLKLIFRVPVEGGLFMSKKYM